MTATNTRDDPGLGPARTFQLLLGVGLIALGTLLLWTYPVGPVWLVALGVVLAALQWRDERAWLIALPVLLPCLDLGT